MGLPLYLAMTEQEIAESPLPKRMAYMACHFSPYGSGLCHIPHSLPAGNMLILDDRVPVWHHDPQEVAWQLAQAAQLLECSRVLLDLQQQNNTQAAKIVQAVVDTLSCPVGVSEAYARELDCPVFITAPKANKPLSSCLALWEGRKIWLEAAVESRVITVTTTGAQAEDGPLLLTGEPVQRDDRLCCSYHIDVKPDSARFTISRTREDVRQLLSAAEGLGVELAVGLYQQFGTAE